MRREQGKHEKDDPAKRPDARSSGDAEADWKASRRSG
jgi:hypothetical protein